MPGSAPNTSCPLAGLLAQPWADTLASVWSCGSRIEGSDCVNNRTIPTDSYERRVLTGLCERMLDPDLVELFVAEYREEYAKRTVRMRREHGAVERRLATATGSC